MFLCIIAITAKLIIKDNNINFLKPFFRLPLSKYIQATATAIPMGEIWAFTMITPMLGKDEKPCKMMALGLTVSATLLFIIMLLDTTTMGPLVTIVKLPSFESVRYKRCMLCIYRS